MNKFGVVLGIAAVATLAGCKNPDFKRKGDSVQNEPKSALADMASASSKAIEIEPAPAKCACAPGTKHEKPCACGASDCKCIVVTKPVVTADLSKPAEPEYTIYVVQNGDYLAKVSKKFNVTIASIRRLNPSIKNDVIRVGQKLKLPGKIDIPTPVAASAATPAASAKGSAKKGYAPYAGATKEYVVKSGDTLGSIAYGNGINIRQLKELNGLSSDGLKIGQKLKIPAEKVVKAAPAVQKPAPVKNEEKQAAKTEVPTEVAVVAPAVVAKPAADPVVEAKEVEVEPASISEVASVAAEPEKAESATAATYVVQEGDDMTGVSIRWGVSAAEIRELNNLGESDQLVPGQIIKLPADAQQ